MRRGDVRDLNGTRHKTAGQKTQRLLKSLHEFSFFSFEMSEGEREREKENTDDDDGLYMEEIHSIVLRRPSGLLLYF
jgi:hypothetical protein